MSASLAMHRAEVSAPENNQNSWVHLVPAGKFDGVDGRGPWIADPVKIVERTRAFHGKRQIVIDYEHQSFNSQTNGKPAPAAGWIVGLEARPDGVWGLVEWTEAAANSLRNREYRYLSPAFHHSKTGEVLAIQNAGLTNTPNLDQLIALARSEVRMEEDEKAGKLANAAKLLGLPQGSDASAVYEKLRPLVDLAFELAQTLGKETPVALNSSYPDPAKFVPIGEFERVVAEANQLRQGITETAAEAHVSDHIRRGVLAPFMKDWAISLCKVNKPAFDSFIEKTGPAFSNVIEPQSVRLRVANGDDAAAKLEDDQIAICKRLGISAEQFNKAQEA
ncbi:phage protease [Brucella anthropi]|uniref:phage protease n=1 Tax=Brucella anthropi TaxID=529 RepID=UPI000F684CD5|nr:phage protease [Brucella anthropi]RRY11500.1 hypothetical protein EGJ58_07555 [Brucella anthropi]